MGVHMSFKPGKLQADAGDPSHGAQPAIQIHLDNPKLQAYQQRYPFAQGPNLEMNQLGRSAIAKGVKFRPTAPNTKTCLLKHEQTLLAAAEQSRAESLLDQIGIPDNEKRMYFDDFEWETNFVPRETKSVLVIGCGNGIELIFLRAVLPNARIMAIDYHDARLPKLGSTVGMQFLQGDICEHLASFDRSYDLIFSNHTLEHLYDPDEMLPSLPDCSSRVAACFRHYLWQARQVRHSCRKCTDLPLSTMETTSRGYTPWIWCTSTLAILGKPTRMISLRQSSALASRT